jgi:hypothetical protein
MPSKFKLKEKRKRRKQVSCTREEAARRFLPISRKPRINLLHVFSSWFYKYILPAHVLYIYTHNNYIFCAAISPHGTKKKILSIKKERSEL